MCNETELYPAVAEFMTNKLDCVKTKTNTGTRFAHIDVLGLRERRSDFASFSELIAVEVKSGGTRVLNYLGQALSYSLYAKWVYLAWKKKNGNDITQEEKDIAAKFGVGLLQISDSNEIEIISTSREFSPDRHYMLHGLYKLGYFECTICRANYPMDSVVSINKKEPINLADNLEYKGKFDQSVKLRKSARFFLYQLAEIRGDQRNYIYDKRFICKDCSSIFAALLPT